MAFCGGERFLWQRMVEIKFGISRGGWCTETMKQSYDVRLCMEIHMHKDLFLVSTW